MSEKKIVIAIVDKSESPILSWSRDLVSFGGLIGTAYVLNTMMEPSGWLNFALAFSWLGWLAGKAFKPGLSIQEARSKLDELEKRAAP